MTAPAHAFFSLHQACFGERPLALFFVCACARWVEGGSGRRDDCLQDGAKSRTLPPPPHFPFSFFLFSSFFFNEKKIYLDLSDLNNCSTSPFYSAPIIYDFIFQMVEVWT